MSPKKFMVIQGPRTAHFANLQRDRAIIGVTTTQNPKSPKNFWAPKSRVHAGESRCKPSHSVFRHMGVPTKPLPPLSPPPFTLGRFYNLPTYRLFGFPKIFPKIPQPPVFIRWRSQFFTRWGAAPPRLSPRRGRLRATVCPGEIFFRKISRARFSKSVCSKSPRF